MKFTQRFLVFPLNYPRQSGGLTQPRLAGSATCTRTPAKSAGATLAPHASAGVVVGVGARPAGSQTVFVSWSWFRQNGVASSHPVVEPVETHQPSSGCYAIPRRGITPAVGRLTWFIGSLINDY